jgi:hypothetical protein
LTIFNYFLPIGNYFVVINETIHYVHIHKKKKKMTQGWVVYGGMRHAEPQREMFSRSYTSTRPPSTS